MKPGVSPPETDAGLTYSEIDSLSAETYSEGARVENTRDAWGAYGMPNRTRSCGTLSYWHDYDIKQPETLVNSNVRDCADGIEAKERIFLNGGNGLKLRLQSCVKRTRKPKQLGKL